MKAIFEFELPNENNEFILATNGGNFWVVLFDFDQWLRSKIKYSEKEEPEYELAREQLHELLYAQNVNLDMVS